MPIEVKLSDVIDALDSAMDEHAYYLDKRSGEIVLVTDDDIAAAENEELMLAAPDWQRESISHAREVLNDSENLLPLPDKFEIHEYRIMEEFCLALDDRHLGSELHRLIKGSGAFRRFRNAIRERNVEQDWYDFKQRALEQIAIEWLKENGIPYSRDGAIDLSEASMGCSIREKRQ
jgi:Uncharacterised protein family (UPF0158)